MSRPNNNNDNRPTPQEKADARAAKQEKRARRRENRGIRRDARRDVGLMMDPYMTNLDKLSGAIDSNYGGFNEAIAPMADSYIGQSQGIQDNYNQNLKGNDQLMQGFASGGPTGENAAANSYLAGLSNAGNLQLSGQQQRGLDYMDRTTTEGNLAQRYANDNIEQQIQDLQSKTPDLIKQRMDELRAQAMEQKSNDAFNSFLESQLGNMLGGGTGPGGGRDGNPYDPNPEDPGPDTPTGPTGSQNSWYNDSTAGRVNYTGPDPLQTKITQWQQPNVQNVGDLPPWLWEAIVSHNAPQGKRHRRIYKGVRESWQQMPPNYYNVTPFNPGGIN